jgi:hypothetical protein
MTIPVTEEKSPVESAVILLFHRLNNQLGIVLANAELLEAKVADESHRARAAQVVAGALQAVATAREIRSVLPTPQP